MSKTPKRLKMSVKEEEFTNADCGNGDFEEMDCDKESIVEEIHDDTSKINKKESIVEEIQDDESDNNYGIQHNNDKETIIDEIRDTVVLDENERVVQEINDSENELENPQTILFSRDENSFEDEYNSEYSYFPDIDEDGLFDSYDENELFDIERFYLNLRNEMYNNPPEELALDENESYNSDQSEAENSEANLNSNETVNFDLIDSNQSEITNQNHPPAILPIQSDESSDVLIVESNNENSDRFFDFPPLYRFETSLINIENIFLGRTPTDLPWRPERFRDRFIAFLNQASERTFGRFVTFILQSDTPRSIGKMLEYCHSINPEIVKKEFLVSNGNGDFWFRVLRDSNFKSFITKIFPDILSDLISLYSLTMNCILSPNEESEKSDTSSVVIESDSNDFDMEDYYDPLFYGDEEETISNMLSNEDAISVISKKPVAIFNFFKKDSLRTFIRIYQTTAYGFDFYPSDISKRILDGCEIVDARDHVFKIFNKISTVLNLAGYSCEFLFEGTTDIKKNVKNVTFNPSVQSIAYKRVFANQLIKKEDFDFTDLRREINAETFLSSQVSIFILLLFFNVEMSMIKFIMESIYSKKLIEPKKAYFTSKEVRKLFKSVCYKDILNKTSDNSCSICLDSFKPSTKCMSLGCMHVYHPKCIIGWLARSNLCPYCKAFISNDGLL